MQTQGDIGIVKSEMIRIRADLDKILKILVEGNGHSLVSKMAVIENEVKGIQKARSQMNIAALTAMMSFVTSLGLIVFEIFIKGK